MVQPGLGGAVGDQCRRTGGVARAAGDVDDRPGAVLVAHLPVDADGEPQRADEVHLDREGVEQHRALEVVVAARRALDLRDERGDVLDVRRGHRAAGVVDQDVDAAVGRGHLRHHCVDGAVIALVADHLGGACAQSGSVSAPGSASSLRTRAADDRGTCAQQFVRDADADAPAGAGDDRDLAVQHAHSDHPQNANGRPPWQRPSYAICLASGRPPVASNTTRLPISTAWSANRS